MEENVIFYEKTSIKIRENEIRITLPGIFYENQSFLHNGTDAYAIYNIHIIYVHFPENTIKEADS